MKNEKLNLIIGINVYRTGVILKDIKNCKYFVVIAGTDANIYMSKPLTKAVMEKTCKKAS